MHWLLNLYFSVDSFFRFYGALSERTCNGIVSGIKGFCLCKGNLLPWGSYHHFSSVPRNINLYSIASFRIMVPTSPAFFKTFFWWLSVRDPYPYVSIFLDSKFGLTTNDDDWLPCQGDSRRRLIHWSSYIVPDAPFSASSAIKSAPPPSPFPKSFPNYYHSHGEIFVPNLIFFPAPHSWCWTLSVTREKCHYGVELG